MDLRLVLIEWHDSHVAVGGWKELEGYSPEVPLCRSVGWLLKDGDQTKLLVPHLIEDQPPYVPRQGCGEMTIPARAIVRMVDLKAPDR